jgi:hypothetical protein
LLPYRRDVTEDSVDLLKDRAIAGIDAVLGLTTSFHKVKVVIARECTNAEGVRHKCGCPAWQVRLLSDLFMAVARDGVLQVDPTIQWLW